MSPEVGRTPPGSRTPDADMSDRVPDREMLLREIVSRQEAEITRLATIAERAQEAERLALAALREEQSRTAVLLAAREIKQIDPATQDALRSPQEPQSGAGTSATGNAAQSEKRPWWAFWKR